MFRIFAYPPLAAGDAAAGSWSVGEHTDYGLLTILAQDDHGGLQVKTGDRWLEVAPMAGAFVCNIGDMLDRVSGGRYRSTPHRVRHLGAGEGISAPRLSFPFFFDPGFDAEVRSIDGRVLVDAAADAAGRWDGANVHELAGSYGDYLLAKVGRVFPQLRAGLER